MSKKPTVTSITSGYASNTQLNNNFTALRDSFDNTLSRDGSTPNSMSADIDLNNNDLLNGRDVSVQSLTINGTIVNPTGLTASGASIVTDDFTGNGSTKTFTLSYAPQIKDHTGVYIDGVYQNKAGYSVTATALTFDTAPPLNSAIEVQVFRSLLTGTTPATNVSYNQGGTGAIDRTAQVKLQETVSVKDFGAVGDGVTDDTVAIQAAINYWLSVRASIPATLSFPPAIYRITGTLDFSSVGLKRGEVTGGNGTFEVATIKADFNGYNQSAAFLFGDDTNPSSSQSEVSVSGFTFEKGAASVNQPVAIVGTRLAQSRISNIRLASWNNVGLSLASPQNCRFENVTLYSGGNSFQYKDTSGKTISQSGTTVTASASIFTSSDVGHFLSAWGPAPNYLRVKLKITGYTSATQVTVASTETFSSFDFYFDNPKVSISSGSTVLTSDASCFSATDVGLTVYVKKAGQNGRLLRAKIATYNSGTSVVLDTSASTSATNVDFCTPSLEVYTDANASNGGSDNTFLNLQIEKHRSVGIVAQDQDILEFLSSKIHSLQSISTSAIFSQSPIWLDQVAGYYQGSFDAQYMGGEKIYAVYQSDSFTFTDLSCRTAYNETILRIDERASGFEGGLVSLDSVSLKGAKSGGTIQDLIVDANTAPIGYSLSGKVSYSDYDQTRYYTGTDGSNGWKDIASPASSISWSGTDPTDLTEAAYQWHRAGNIVWFAFRLEYGTAGSSNTSVSIEKQTDMPSISKPSASSPTEMIMPCDGFIDSNLTGPGALCKAYMQHNSGTDTFVAVLNSSSISAVTGFVSGFYFTE